MPISAENRLIDKTDVAAELFQLLARFQPMDLDRRIETSTQNLLSIARKSNRSNTLTVSTLKSTHTLTSRNLPNFDFSIFYRVFSTKIYKINLPKNEPVFTRKLIFESKESVQNLQKTVYMYIKLVPWAPVTNISESLEKLIVRTAVSIIIKLSCAWYFKSFLILPVK